MGLAGEQAGACLTAPELAGLWSRPDAAGAEVWRERPFEVVLEGVWISGVFDRVVVARDSAGRATAAMVYDFKTNRVAEPSELPALAARHASQLNLYRRAAGILTGLDSALVTCHLVSTALQRAIPLPPQ